MGGAGATLGAGGRRRRQGDIRYRRNRRGDDRSRRPWQRAQRHYRRPYAGRRSGGGDRRRRGRGDRFGVAWQHRQTYRERAAGPARILRVCGYQAHLRQPNPHHRNVDDQRQDKGQPHEGHRHHGALARRVVAPVLHDGFDSGRRTRRTGDVSLRHRRRKRASTQSKKVSLTVPVHCRRQQRAEF